MKINIWNIFSKIVIILTAIASLLAIISFLSNIFQNRIDARIKIMNFEMSPTQVNYIEKVDKVIDNNNIRNNIESWIKSTTKDESKYNDAFGFSYQLSDNIISGLKEELGLPDRYSSIFSKYPNYSNYSVLNIKNNGNKKIIDIKVLLPYSGEYKITLSKDNYLMDNFKGEISISEIYPKQEIIIETWSRDYISYFDNERFIISHNNGSKKIDIISDISGIGAYIYNNLYIFIYNIILIGLLLFVINKKIEKKNKKKEIIEKKKSKKQSQNKT